MIKVDNVSKTYGTQKVLNGITLEIKRNEILGIIGHNGAGKTTLMRIMAGIKKTNQGSVSVMGENPLKNFAVKNKIGYMPETVYFDDEMSGETFLEIMGMFWRIKKDAVAELLNFCGLKNVDGKKIKNYSKGMVQRLLLAQTLLNDPGILFLDEPNSAIDPQGTRDIRDLILKLSGEGKTIIINSHQLSELEKICTRVIFIKKGSIVAELNMDKTEDPQDYIIDVKGNREKIQALSTEFEFDFDSIGSAGERYFQFTIPGKNKKQQLLERLLDEGFDIERVIATGNNLESLFFKYVAEEEK
ncbi:MAG: ABC transporter ATP-binding protein [bacterium]|nr:ABC transporter ATP-binding protein [bacterium]